MEKLISLVGLFVLIFIAYLFSNNKKKIDFKLVVWGIALQLIFALLILKTNAGKTFFEYINDIIVKLLSFTEKGASFIFADLTKTAFFGFSVLPTIIFFSSFMAVLYYFGIMQFLVKYVAKVMSKTMKTSGSESLSAAANIFVGQTEAPLVIKPFIETMTSSELFAIMVGGMATVAGGVMAAYVGMLKNNFPNIAGHLMAASIMSAPAALVIAKIMVPETEKSKTAGKIELDLKSTDANVIDAAARGAGEGLTLALNVGAMLLAFIALIALVNSLFISLSNGINHVLGKNPTKMVVKSIDDFDSIKPGYKLKVALNNKKSVIYNIKNSDKKSNSIIIELPKYKKSFYYGSYSNVGFEVIDTNSKTVAKGKLDILGGFILNLEIILGFLFAPLAFIMGVPWKDSQIIGNLLGEKIILNEFIAYSHLGDILNTSKDLLSERSVIIATYALCGFANLGSIAIQIGGIGGIAPQRRAELAQFGVRAVIAGSIAAFMTATIAGILV